MFYCLQTLVSVYAYILFCFVDVVVLKFATSHQQYRYGPSCYFENKCTRKLASSHSSQIGLFAIHPNSKQLQSTWPPSRNPPNKKKTAPRNAQQKIPARLPEQQLDSRRPLRARPLPGTPPFEPFTVPCSLPSPRPHDYSSLTTPCFSSQLYDRISSRVVAPARAPQGDAVQRARDAADALSELENRRDADHRDLQELRDLLCRPHFKVSAGGSLSVK